MIICLGTTPCAQRTMRFNRLVLDEVNRARQTDDYASGKSINVAKVLRALGEDCLAIGFLGGDSGRMIRRDLDARGIRHDFVEVTPPTRMCLTIIDDANQVTELVEEAAPVDGVAFSKLLETLDANLWRAKVLVLSGTVAPGADATFYAACTRVARAAGVAVVIDAREAQLANALAEGVAVAKPNRSELAATFGVTIQTDADLRDAMRRCADAGAKWVVTTMGKDGAAATDGRSFWRIHAPAIEAVNPIGSGDSVAAGLAAALVRRLDLPEACRLAIACGSANALTERAGEVHTEDVHRLSNAIRVEAW
jgi:tagatose 6-phosphate kinase